MRSAIGPLRLLLAVTIVLPLLLLTLVGWKSYGGAFEDAGQALDRAADVACEHAGKVFDTHRLVAQRAADLVAGLDEDAIAQAEPVLHSALKGMIADLPQIRSVAIIGRDGHPLVSALTFPVPRDADARDHDFFKVMQAGRERLFISEVYAGRLLPEPVFGLSERLSGPGGEFEGLVNVAVPQSFFERFYATLVARPDDVIVLAREDGEMLARAPVAASELRRFPPTSRIMTEIGRSPEAGHFIGRAAVDGAERVFAYRRIAPYPVYVIASRPVASILADWRRKMASYLLFGFPETVGLFAITLVALRRARREEAALRQARDEFERRQAAEAALRQAQKLEAVGQLTGGVAHDFNNLLLVIGGNVEVLRRRLNDPGALRSLDAIERAAARGERLTRHLLSFSRKKAAATTLIDLPERVPYLRELLEGTLRPGIRLELDLPEDLWPVEIDAGELELALLNLALNARDAMPQGGVVRVTGRNLVLEQGPETGDLAGEVVALTVGDTGQGIPPDILQRVFEPFFTTKEVGKGTGLGLSQVYGFAQQSGGAATVRSTLGQGTAVTIYLPRARRVAPPAAGTREAGAAAGGRTVLLVEDHPEVSALGRSLLAEAGYRVRDVPDAEAALDLLEAGEAVDLVLTDIVMPGMSGLELARRLRASHPGLPVLLATGYSEAAEDAERDGFLILHKPYHRGVIEAGVRIALARAIDRAEPR